MLKILVIDDERSIRNTLKDILGFEGYQVEMAENGIIGIELVKSTDFDIILCDIKMPEMDGLEVLEQIMQIKPESTVVMISGHGTIDTAGKPNIFSGEPLTLSLLCMKNTWFLTLAGEATNLSLQKATAYSGKKAST